MIKQLFTATALAATLCAGGAAQAALVTFDDPGVIDVDNTTQVATYTEAGVSVTGQAASFLPLDMRLAGGDRPNGCRLRCAVLWHLGHFVTESATLRAEARSHDPAFRERLLTEITRAFERAAKELT